MNYLKFTHIAKVAVRTEPAKHRGLLDNGHATFQTFPGAYKEESGVYVFKNGNKTSFRGKFSCEAKGPVLGIGGRIEVLHEDGSLIISSTIKAVEEEALKRTIWL